ncbi:hypothetical protein MMC29_003605, partial [Sticta canariensis]|nr:hypothetical protein [Sticta canariensis]
MSRKPQALDFLRQMGCDTAQHDTGRAMLHTCFKAANAKPVIAESALLQAAHSRSIFPVLRMSWLLGASPKACAWPVYSTPYMVPSFFRRCASAVNLCWGGSSKQAGMQVQAFAIPKQQSLVHCNSDADAVADYSVDFSQRPRIQSIIGKEAEALVWTFCVMDLASLDATMEHESGQHFVVARAQQGGMKVPLSDAQYRQLITVQLADWLEQASRPTVCLQCLQCCSDAAELPARMPISLFDQLNPTAHISCKTDQGNAWPMPALMPNHIAECSFCLAGLQELTSLSVMFGAAMQVERYSHMPDQKLGWQPGDAWKHRRTDALAYRGGLKIIWLTCIWMQGKVHIVSQSPADVSLAGYRKMAEKLSGQPYQAWKDTYAREPIASRHICNDVTPVVQHYNKPVV